MREGVRGTFYKFMDTFLVNYSKKLEGWMKEVPPGYDGSWDQPYNAGWNDALRTIQNDLRKSIKDPNDTYEVG